MQPQLLPYATTVAGSPQQAVGYCIKHPCWHAALFSSVMQHQ